MTYPLFELKAGLTTIDLDPDKAKVESAFHSASYPRQLWRIDLGGQKTCLLHSRDCPPPRKGR